jgi:hypothetical protein
MCRRACTDARFSEGAQTEIMEGNYFFASELKE